MNFLKIKPKQIFEKTFEVKIRKGKDLNLNKRIEDSNFNNFLGALSELIVKKYFNVYREKFHYAEKNELDFSYLENQEEIGLEVSTFFFGKIHEITLRIFWAFLNLAKEYSQNFQIEIVSYPKFAFDFDINNLSLDYEDSTGLKVIMKKTDRKICTLKTPWEFWNKDVTSKVKSKIKKYTGKKDFPYRLIVFDFLGTEDLFHINSKRLTQNISLLGIHLYKAFYHVENEKVFLKFRRFDLFERKKSSLIDEFILSEFIP